MSLIPSWMEAIAVAFALTLSQRLAAFICLALRAFFSAFILARRALRSSSIVSFSEGGTSKVTFGADSTGVGETKTFSEGALASFQAALAGRHFVEAALMSKPRRLHRRT